MNMVKAEIIYRGSENGWMDSDFHSRCDFKSPTITLFKIKDGDCIGGYTEAQWSSKGEIVGDKKAILFNLTRARYFPSIESTKAIGCFSGHGPCFRGSQKGELVAVAPYNCENNCYSYPA